MKVDHIIPPPDYLDIVFEDIDEKLFKGLGRVFRRYPNGYWCWLCYEDEMDLTKKQEKVLEKCYREYLKEEKGE